jgi:hypothetical protein
MGAVLAAAVKTATTTAAKPAAKAAAKTALKSGASRTAARSAANRAAVATKVNAGKQVAIEKGKDAAIRAAAKPVDNALSETLSVTADGLLKGILATGIAGVAVVGIAITGYDKMTSSGLGFAPWMLQLMGLNMPGFGLSLPGLPDFGLGGGGGVSADGQKIADAAMGYVGKSFKPGVSAQCAVFVRAVLADAGVSVGVTNAPIDGKSTGPAMANSFYGNDLGTIIKDKGALQPGDIVMFFNTYGSWPAGTVTHVGVYVGGGMMVDRPTASRPVQHRSIDTFEFAGALRIPSAESIGATALTDDELLCAIGESEGTRNADCSPNRNYFGHTDPGNGASNIGTFSAQQNYATPEQADASWLQKLRSAEKTIQSQAVSKFGQPLSKAALLAALDLHVQSPAAAADIVKHLPSNNPSVEQIIAARANTYIDPRTGRLNAPGLGNSMARVRADQSRRVGELMRVLQRG